MVRGSRSGVLVAACLLALHQLASLALAYSSNNQNTVVIKFVEKTRCTNLVCDDVCHRYTLILLLCSHLPILIFALTNQKVVIYHVL